MYLYDHVYTPEGENSELIECSQSIVDHHISVVVYIHSGHNPGSKASPVMARSKWISFGAQQQLERAAKAAATPTALSLPTSADAKKFGLENVRIQGDFSVTLLPYLYPHFLLNF